MKALIAWLRRLLGRGGNWYFKGDFQTWEEASAGLSGYSDPAILKRVLQASLDVKRGSAAFERDGMLFDKVQYSWPVLAGLLFSRNLHKDSLSVLDYGGSLGTSYFQNKRFLRHIHRLTWCIVEQNRYIEVGKKTFQDNTLKFYKSIDESFIANFFDCILLSAVLDVIPELDTVVNRLLKERVSVVIVDRSVFLKQSYDEGKDYYVRQYVANSIFPAVLPFRFISFVKIRKVFEDHGYQIVETFPSIGGSGDTWEFSGFIAKRDFYGGCA